MFWRRGRKATRVQCPDEDVTWAPMPKIVAYTDDEDDWEVVDMHEAKGLESYDIIGVVGRGASADVYLAHCKCTGREVALKVVDKHVYFGKARKLKPEAIMREREIMVDVGEGCCSNYFCALHEAFQTENSVVLAQEYMPRGDLFRYVSQVLEARRAKFLDEATVKFFAAQLCCALDSLHAKQIVYRDVKLENILLDENFYIKLSDFGLSRYLKKGGGKDGAREDGGDRCKTFAGTSAFIAPEILRGRCYDYSVDWWAAGVLFYGLLTGKFPFWADQERDMYVRIIRKPLLFPDEAHRRLSPESISFVSALLRKAPNERLTGEQVFKHPWFHGVDWGTVRDKTLPPPESMCLELPPLEPAAENGGKPCPRKVDRKEVGLSPDQQRAFFDFDYVSECSS
eukprot:TRINITY_DN3981_c0_g1_i1.p1 TRINITY_DN3981_c0_g1~~TRINITY_DN3981_c0_g1_i1.p1  ORF type:complete len:398 (+),score=138.96 TRINITY_DN3981_c0_g1_i1:53-1246(+)